MPSGFLGIWNDCFWPKAAAHCIDAFLRSKNNKPGTRPGLLLLQQSYLISTARLSWIFFCQIAGPVMCTDSPLVSTATVTGMSLTSNS